MLRVMNIGRFMLEEIVIFSHAVINDYHGLGRLIIIDRLPPLKAIYREFIGNMHKVWPSKAFS